MEPSYRGFSLLAIAPSFVVINKHPGVGMHDEEGVKGLVSLAREQLGLELYPVHRLDKVTSGVLLLARDPQSNRLLSMSFAERQVEKHYVALSREKPGKKQGWIKGDMSRGRRGTWLLQRSMTNPAITWFESGSVDGSSLRLFHVMPKTGKTHQIRVALKSIGAPILGDASYGGEQADRVYLHALALRFVFEGREYCYQAMPEQGALFLLPAVQQSLVMTGKKCQPQGPDENINTQ